VFVVIAVGAFQQAAQHLGEDHHGGAGREAGQGVEAKPFVEAEVAVEGECQLGQYRGGQHQGKAPPQFAAVLRPVQPALAVGSGHGGTPSTAVSKATSGPGRKNTSKGRAAGRQVGVTLGTGASPWGLAGASLSRRKKARKITGRK